MADGTPVDGPIALKDALIAEEDMFVTTFINRMLTYSIGRGLEYYDKPTIRAIARTAKEEDYRFSVIVQEIAKSLPSGYSDIKLINIREIMHVRTGQGVFTGLAR